MYFIIIQSCAERSALDYCNSPVEEGQIFCPAL